MTDRARRAAVDGVSWVDLGDVTVRYRAAGHGEPVVFVHGLAEDHRSWAVPQESLPWRRTYAYDLRGHGETTLGDARGDLAQLGGDLVAFLEHTGPATVVGFSLGGTIVLWAAAERPDLVTGVVTMATSSVVGRRARDLYDARRTLLAQDAAAFAEALREDTAVQIVTPGIDLDALTARRLAAVGDGGGYRNAAAAMAGLHDEPLTPRLAEVRCPVLVVGGEHDAFCPGKASRIIVEHLADATFVEVEDVGHLLNVERPDHVVALLDEWLRRPRRPH